MAVVGKEVALHSDFLFRKSVVGHTEVFVPDPVQKTALSKSVLRKVWNLVSVATAAAVDSVRSALFDGAVFCRCPACGLVHLVWNLEMKQ